MTRFARLSSARYLVPVGTVAAGIALLTDGGRRGGWGDTVLRATTHLLLILPFAMTAAAVDARRVLRPAAYPSAAGSVRPVAAVVLTAIAPAVWGVAGYLVVVLTGFAATARVNPLFPPPVPVWWIVAGGAAVVAHAAVGVLLGRALPLLVAVGLSAVTGLLGNAALAAHQGWVPALFTVADDAFLGGAVVPRTIVQVAQTGFFLAAAAAAVAGTVLLVRRTPRVVGLCGVLVLVTVAAGSGLAAIGGAKHTVVAEAAGPRVCTDDGVVCLWRDHAYLLAGYAQTGRRMLGGAPAAIPMQGWTEVGLRRPTGHAELWLTNNAPTAVDRAVDLAGAAIKRIAPLLAPRQALDAEVWLAARALDGAARADFVAAHGSPVAAVLARPVPDQWDWFLRMITAG
jgi:hypothetical protein